MRLWGGGTVAAVADHGETSPLVRHLDSTTQVPASALPNEVRAVAHPCTVQELVEQAAPRREVPLHMRVGRETGLGG
ncbi:hypothetical protein ACFY12_12145 [Streptomyces sp. NPDC001339]|uniref:hypothetical protein n=1 Tax=Streptomyces sp. NPDC001339 TaxID=3364563 RepID=UPI0036A8ABDA